MSINTNFILYHNPETMGEGFEGEVAGSGRIATNKTGVAEKAMEERGIIWCIGRKGDNSKRYFLYQRIIEPITRKGDEFFKITLEGIPTFPKGYKVDVTDEAYFPEIKKLLGFGLQRLSNPEVIRAFETVFRDSKN